MNQQPILTLVPLGGLGRIGGNMMAYETTEDIVVVDCGTLFPSDAEQPGVDYVIPDIAYLLERRHKVRGMVLTHGHEDHIGALPYVLPQLNVPLFATPFTAALVRAKLSEFPDISATIHEIGDGQKFNLGCLSFEPIAVTHSIPGAVALAIETPIGLVVHSGDFKFDPAPLDGRVTDVEALARCGARGVALLLSDSTNAGKAGQTWSESEVAHTLDELIIAAPRRVFVTTFASNLHRLQAILQASARAGRHVVALGRSMQQNLAMAFAQGFLPASANVLLPAEDFAALPPHAVTCIASGCQGEPRSAMARLAAAAFTGVQVEAGDRVIVSSRRIPGNERSVATMLNALYRMGAEVITDRTPQVHTSGHAFYQEQERMIELCRPQAFMPIHGEYQHLVLHAQLAQRAGVAKERIYITEDGRPLEFTRQGTSVVGRAAAPVEAGFIYVDGKGVGDVLESVLRERRYLAQSGVVCCVVVLDEEDQLVGEPRLLTRGVVYADEGHTVIDTAIAEVRQVVQQHTHLSDDEARAEQIRLGVRRVFRRMLDRRPEVMPCIIRLNA